MSGAHAKLSPSGAVRWLNCPGSVAAEEGYPDDSSEHARLGTAAHELGAWCLENNAVAEARRGDVIHVEGQDFTVDADMIRYVDGYVSQVLEANTEADHMMVEVRVPIDHITDEDGAGGTSDVIGVQFAPDSATVRVHDLKYGQGVRVEAEDNTQLVMYASGAIRELDWLLDGFGDDEIHLELYIHQVRLDNLPVWHLTLAELREWEELLRDGAKRCTPDAPRIPGEAQCRFCKHRRACPELRALVEETVAEEPPQDAAGVAEAMPRLKMIRDWCATVEARAIELCEQDDPTIGKHYKLVEGRRSRVWAADPAAVERRLKYKTGLKQDDIYEKKLVSVAQAQKLVPKSEWPRIEKVVETRAGKPTIAPIDDKRPAVNGAAAMGFDEVTE